MLRFIIPTAALLLALPFSAQAASLQDFELNKTLQKVAEESNVGTPGKLTRTSWTKATRLKVKS